MVTPTSRSLDWLRKQGYVAGVVEHWLTFPETKNGKPTGKTIRVRKDLFNVFDIVAVHPGIHGTLFVQTTDDTSVSKRLLKVLAQPEITKIIKAGNGVQIHGWGLKGAAGKRKLYQVRVLHLGLTNGSDVPVIKHDGYPDPLPTGKYEEPEEEPQAKLPGMLPEEVVI